MWVRAGTAADVPVLREVERRAGRAVGEVGTAEVAAAEPPSVEALEGYVADGRCAVAVDDDERPVGYVVVDRVDACAHVDRVAVDPDRQGQGVGRALLAWAEDWARADGRRGITLTTFRDGPGDAPLQERLGYRVLSPDEVGPGLMTVVSEEAARGLDPGSRVCLQKDL